jgi:hypothetical protein
MFGMLRNLARPFLGMGRKLGNIFRLGRKASPIVQDARNVMEFVDLAPPQLRSRTPVGNVNLGQGFYSTMTDALSNYKYPN